ILKYFGIALLNHSAYCLNLESYQQSSTKLVQDRKYILGYDSDSRNYTLDCRSVNNWNTVCGRCGNSVCNKIRQFKFTAYPN
ncbi:28750_t:CDS:2, partial [Dentiscutata erythropus]